MLHKHYLFLKTNFVLSLYIRANVRQVRSRCQTTPFYLLDNINEQTNKHQLRLDLGVEILLEDQYGYSQTLYP